jgi:aminoglycoside phosphotransferase (APT) family kinase protein
VVQVQVMEVFAALRLAKHCHKEMYSRSRYFRQRQLNVGVECWRRWRSKEGGSVVSGDLRQMSEYPMSPWRALGFLHPEKEL